MLDCLIVGHGIAGTLLANELLEAGLSIKVFHWAGQPGCSENAAGVINPVTGRRFVKSWKIDELLAIAKSTYASLEQKYQKQYLQHRCILQALNNTVDEEQWLMRTGDPEYHDYLDQRIRDQDNPVLTIKTVGLIREALQIDLPGLVRDSVVRLRSLGLLVEEMFDHRRLQLSKKGVSYRQFESRLIIFCEGSGAVRNPYFSWLPFQPAKGELLRCRIPGLQTEDIIKSKLTIAPLNDQEEYWVGATYDWDFVDASTTNNGRAYLEQHLQSMLTGMYEVISHQAAIRPTTKDRRPFLGFHPEYPQIGMFNGLGTKGASLAPYCSRLLSQAILYGANIPPEVNILRHSPR